MALPTAATPGYGYFPTVTSHPDVACNCLRVWLPKLQQLARHRGILAATEKLRVIQCTGGASASAGTHSLGGAWDAYMPDVTRWHNATTRDYRIIGPKTLALLALAREMGSEATWPRIDVDGRADGDPWENNEHLHGVLRGCPHNTPARYQIAEYDRGEDGLTGTGRDTYPRPTVSRTWEQGITWATTQLTTPAEEDDMFTDQDRATLAYVSKQVKAVAALVLADDAEKDGYYADLKALLAAQPKQVADQVWLETKVRRGDAYVPAIQELANDVSASARLEALMDPDALAAKIAAAMPKGATVERTDLEAALRTVLGSLDG